MKLNWTNLITYYLLTLVSGFTCKYFEIPFGVHLLVCIVLYGFLPAWSKVKVEDKKDDEQPKN